jgi:hypothetical protein
MGHGEVTCLHRWARVYEVDPNREGGSKELRGDGADIQWESGILARNCLRWEEVWKLVSHVCNAVGDNHVRVRVYVHPDV